MAEIIRFLFSSFWTWLGTLILIVAGNALGVALRGIVRITITRTEK